MAHFPKLFCGFKLVLKKEQLAYLVDFLCPFDDNVEIKKVDKYQDLH